MSRKHPPQYYNKKTKPTQPTSNSILSVNGSFLEQGYQDTSTLSHCFACKKKGNSFIMSICDCYSRLYHQECLKRWLGNKLVDTPDSVKMVDSVYEVECQGCGYPIKFKASPKQRCRSRTEVWKYCSAHKLFAAGLGLVVGILIGCIIYLLLLGLKVIAFCRCNLSKQAFIIGLAVVIFFLFLISLCCFLDCLRTQTYKVETVYDSKGKSSRPVLTNQKSKLRRQAR